MPPVFSFPIPLSRAAFEELTSEEERPMPEAKDPRIPVMTFERSACGLYFFYKDERVFVVIVLPVAGLHEGHILTGFYGGVLSNFPRVNGAKWMLNGKCVDFKDGEQVFKAACTCAHMDPSDETSDKALNLIKVLNAVMSAKSPKSCKFAVRGIPKEEFDGEMWDRRSPDIMYFAQLWKLTDPLYFGFFKCISGLAKLYNIPFVRCFFFEAASTDDLIWGTGLSVDGMFDALTLNVASPEWCFHRGYPKPYNGKNQLGEALDLAFTSMFGANGERSDCTLEEYCELIGGDCPLFSYDPELFVEQGDHKRARILSEDSASPAKTDDSDADAGIGLLQRCLSE
jgi:hypothetical protein